MKIKSLFALSFLLCCVVANAQTVGEKRINAVNGRREVWDGISWSGDVSIDYNAIKSVADLIAIPDPANGELRKTLGYVTSRLGAESYQYDATSDAAIEGGKVLPGIGGALSFDASHAFDGTAGKGRWLAVSSDLPTPAEMGAVPSDPTTHRSAIQRAIDHHGGIRIPAGTTWTLEERITLAADSLVIGEGATSVLKWTEKESPGFYIPAGADRVEIRNVHLIGSGKFRTLPHVLPGHPGLAAGYAIYAVSAERVTVRGCTIEQWGLGGVEIQSGSYHRIVDNFLLKQRVRDEDQNSNCDIWITGAAANVVVARNVCLSNNKQNIALGSGMAGSRFLVANNLCVKLDDDGTLADVPGAHHMLIGYGNPEGDQVVSGNLCYHSGFAGIYVAGLGRGTQVTGNNCIKNGQIETSTLAGGISVNGTGGQMNIVGNTVRDYGGRSGAITAAGGSGSHVTISNNTIDGSAGPGIRWASMNSFVTIESNDIRRTAKHGILNYIVNGIAPHTGHYIVRDNRCHMTSGYPGIRVTTPVDQGIKSVIIDGNYCWSETQPKDGLPGFHGTYRSAGIIYGGNNLNSPLFGKTAITNNTVNGFACGIALAGRADGRLVGDLVVKGNTIRNAIQGYYAFQLTLGGPALIAIEDSTEQNVTTLFAAPTNRHAAVRGTVQGDKITHYADTLPTFGDWIVGDRMNRETPAAGGYIGAVCTAAGDATTATWKDWGAIAP